MTGQAAPVLRGAVCRNATARISRPPAGLRRMTPRRILAEYTRHYNEHRPHQSREQRPPMHKPGQAVDMTTQITYRQVVHGLISEYRRAA